MGRMDPTHKYAQYLTDAFKNRDVDPEQMASILSMAGHAMGAWLFKFAVRVIRNLAKEYDYGDFSESENPDHASAVIRARQLQDVVDRWP